MRTVPAPTQPGWFSDGLRACFNPVAVILSPPRSGSTALARSLWQNAAFRCYLHEPFDRAYHDRRAPSPKTVLGSVLDRAAASSSDGSGKRGGIVIKEMTFQARELAAELIDAATLPVILLIRDPRLALSSRMGRLDADGQPPGFPAREGRLEGLHPYP